MSLDAPNFGRIYAEASLGLRRAVLRAGAGRVRRRRAGQRTRGCQRYTGAYPAPTPTQAPSATPTLAPYAWPTTAITLENAAAVTLLDTWGKERSSR